MKSFFCLLLCSTFAAACSDNQAPTADVINEAPAPSAESAVNKSGKAVFEKHCTGCHGSGGTAGIGNAANLHTSSLDSTAIMGILQKGRGGMPSFKEVLNPEEMTQVRNYVVQLRR